MAVYLAFKEIWHNRGRYFLISMVVALITTLVLFIAALAEGLGSGNREYIEKLDAELLVYQSNVGLNNRPARGDGFCVSAAACRTAYRVGPGAVGGMMGEVLQAAEVVKEYGDGVTRVVAVDRVSFSVASGEFVGLVGPSGSGKTSMLAMLAGLLRPTAGEICIAGRRPSGRAHRKLGY